jgi:hypothetical protein
LSEFCEREPYEFLHPRGDFLTRSTFTTPTGNWSALIKFLVNVANRSALLATLDAADCGVGDAVQGIFARPEFTVSVLKAELDLAVVSVAELRPPLD